MSEFGIPPDNSPQLPASLELKEGPLGNGKGILNYLPAWNEYDDVHGHDATYSGATKKQFRTDFDGINDTISFSGADLQSPTPPWMVTATFMVRDIAGPMIICGQGSISPPNLGWGLYINDLDDNVYGFASTDGTALHFAATPVAATRNVEAKKFQAISMWVSPAIAYLITNGQVTGLGVGGQPGAINVSSDFMLGGSSDPSWLLDGELFSVRVEEEVAFPTLDLLLAHHNKIVYDHNPFRSVA